VSSLDYTIVVTFHSGLKEGIAEVYEEISGRNIELRKDHAYQLKEAVEQAMLYGRELV
jgi:hypothetical protein